MTERVELICDFSEAQAILTSDKRKHTTGDSQLDKFNDRYQCAVNLVADFVQDRSVGLIHSDGFSLSTLLDDQLSRIRAQPSDCDLATDLLYPVLVDLMNMLFEFKKTPCEFGVPLVIEYLNDSPDSIISHFRNSIPAPGAKASPLIHLLSRELDADTTAGALAMFLGVSVAPMANLCIFGILADQSERTIGGDCDPRSLFERVCRTNSPIFPGIFRDLGEDRRNALIPATWPDGISHFTFGFGKYKCPGRGLSAHVFAEVLNWWQSNNLSFTGVTERNSFPFAAGSISISLRSDNG